MVCPGVTNDVLTYSDERITEVLAGKTTRSSSRVYGQDQDVLAAKAEEVRAAIAGIDGIENAEAELPPQEPTIEVEVDLIEEAESVGIKPGDVRRAAATLLSGLEVGSLFEEQKVFDVVVWGTPEIRQNLSRRRDLLIDTPAGGHVRLGEVADVRIAPSRRRHPARVRRSYLDVGAGVAGRDVGAVVDDVEVAARRDHVPARVPRRGARRPRGGCRARSRVIGLVVAAAIGIFLLLQAAFASWRLARSPSCAADGARRRPGGRVGRRR